MPFVITSSDALGVDEGQHTTVAAVDTVQTDLREVYYVLAFLRSAPVAGVSQVTAAVPSQATSPGAITIKTWKPTAGNNSAPTAATTFSVVVDWIAFGR